MKLTAVLCTAVALAGLTCAAPTGNPGSPAQFNCMADVLAHNYLHKRSGSWSYEGKTGPAHWAELDPSFAKCAQGQNQSPINLEDEHLLSHQGPSISWCKSVQKATFVNNGHTVQVNIPASSASALTVGNQTYTLKQFHFHSPSEHHKHEKYYPLEAHFVHATSDQPPKLAVVGVFFELSNWPNMFLAQLVDYIPGKTNQTREIPELKLDWLSRHIQGDQFWQYSGSLTTPPCSEGVSWNVVDSPLTISMAQLKAFTKAMPYNSRFTL
ncbi:alpha carbonic anhydrase [Polychytrium aggregatum]|uniref:alpha carbonic anhydrase n=1 Tax=Polychytrium aggregatum TaxID=110093 RepID=UPI0022FE75AC|nr:alpha carbonic anhydrase [Polychytrium aggregatum]KAI9208333.1 alpha carbonic anhydrase [Polychytrium aggregatum]